MPDWRAPTVAITRYRIVAGGVGHSFLPYRSGKDWGPLMTTLVQKKRTSAIVMALVAAGMLALGFAAVPLYRMFCQVTGFNGPTQRDVSGSRVQVAAGPTMSIRFDSNVTPGLPWKFYPEHPTDRS